MSTIHQDNALNLEKSVSSHGAYRLSRVLPLSGSQSVTLNQSSVSEVMFELPSKVMNLAKSTLDFNVHVPESATTDHITRLNTFGANWIDRVSLYSREGTFLCDLINNDKFQRAMLPYLTKVDDFLQYDSSRGSASNNQVALNSRTDKGANFFRSNASLGDAGVILLPNPRRVGPTGVAEVSDIGYTEQNYYIQGGARDGSGAGDIYLKYSFPLSIFKHTLLAMDKDLYFGGNSVILRVHFAPVDRIGWTSPASGDIATGAVNISTAVQLTNMRVYQAIETNPIIVESLLQRVRSEGLQLTIPYVYSYLYNSPAGSNSSVQQKLNRGHGSRLLSVYHTVFSSNPTNAARFEYDISNNPNGVTSNAKVLTFQSQLDNQNLQEFLVDTSQQEDFQLMAPALKGSVVQSSDIYRHSRVWMDSWRQGRTCDYPNHDSMQIIDGLPLDEEHQWTIAQTTTTQPAGAAAGDQGFRQYSFIVVQRDILITADGSINYL